VDLSLRAAARQPGGLEEGVIYRYKCPDCGTLATLTRRIDERDEPVWCLKCGELARRCVELAGFVLRGKGWARDGYEN